MGASAVRRIRSIGVHEQAAWMQREHPGFEISVHDGILKARGLVQPSELHETYQVRLEYRVWDSPKVYVEQPKLKRIKPDERIPHTYLDDDETERPCLYLPQTGEWSSEKKIALTIIPWLSMWLFFYEAWRVTGDWFGGGAHPTRQEPIVKRPITWSPMR